MPSRLQDCLENRQDTGYIFPFLWLHGESHERLREEILAIKQSGLTEFCAESRPYENFCKEDWWEDFGFILKTARELGMRVWLLDDRHFPTGYANGYLEAPERAHLRKKQIRERQSEAIGPMKNAKIHVGGWAKPEQGERLIGVVAYRHCDGGEGLDAASAIDLTDTLRDGMVYFDVPEGVWRICVLIETHANASDRFQYYIDMLNPDSCHAMIDAVYQPHFDRFKEYFGNTFRGFFSDEPAFLNRIGSYQSRPGRMHEPFPYREDLPALMAEGAGVSEAQMRLWLPALWEELGDVTANVRSSYMDTVTHLYRDNFSRLLGDWCRAHGVLYIGHVIEDQGAHMHLGYGSGHFFRALDGQDMAGMDIVLHQDIPGLADHMHRASITEGGLADPAFFRYTLPKLAASHAHIDPLKKGRAMCEIFGAFGWGAGLPFMRGLADVMLCSGINHFVPHAFSAKSEDPDCPPHFYNGGKNIQYPLFERMMGYMSRCAHLLYGGVHRADVAVYYNAEGEWNGSAHKVFHSLCRTLTRGLADFDIIPFDTLLGATVSEKRLCVNGEGFGALIVSGSEALPYDRLYRLAELARAGLPVIFTDILPGRSVEGRNVSDLLPCFELLREDELVAALRDRGLCHVCGKGQGLTHLRFYHVVQEGCDVYAFSNEDIRHDVDAILSLPQRGECLVYEPFDNRLYRLEATDKGLHLKIEKGNLLTVIFDQKAHNGVEFFKHEVERTPLDLRFDISLRDEDAADFTPYAEGSPLLDISTPDRLPHFSGEIRYKTRFEAKEGFTVLDLGEVGETAEAWLNGEYLGTRINAPYKFSLQKALRQGENELTVLVRSNLGHRRRDSLSRFIQLPPSGIQGDVALCRYERLD